MRDTGDGRVRLMISKNIKNLPPPPSITLTLTFVIVFSVSMK